VLVSGDGDYVPLIEYLQKSSGKRVEVAAFGETVSSKVIDVVDSFIDLSGNKEMFLIPDRGMAKKHLRRPPNHPISPRINKKIN
jgi:uncharacterized LabA/DUF88 family protein